MGMGNIGKGKKGMGKGMGVGNMGKVNMGMGEGEGDGDDGMGNICSSPNLGILPVLVHWNLVPPGTAQNWLGSGTTGLCWLDSNSIGRDDNKGDGGSWRSANTNHHRCHHHAPHQQLNMQSPRHNNDGGIGHHGAATTTRVMAAATTTAQQRQHRPPQCSHGNKGSANNCCHDGGGDPDADACVDDDADADDDADIDDTDTNDSDDMDTNDDVKFCAALKWMQSKSTIGQLWPTQEEPVQTELSWSLKIWQPDTTDFCRSGPTRGKIYKNENQFSPVFPN
ncbi:hypothetical protein EDB89DRAFT_1902834 [Lactarius sanguifluus]|nr:hypothetical protein EDB89DRAFT_1902834 [Lactarius sanguifluus]